MTMPFPGMDPYLEHPVLWPSVHTRLMVWMAHQLRPLIRPRYVASIEELIFIEGPEQERAPDIWIQKAHKSSRGKVPSRSAAATPVVVEVPELEVHQPYIEILDRYREMKVVTVIELVSPSNKAGGSGRAAYLEKQREVRAGEAHLVEIDLLRYGRHVVGVPEAYALAHGPYDYLVSVNRWPKRARFELYPCRLRERLPSIHIPLAEPDPDVPLDLQAALEQVYEDGDYMLRVLYDKPCIPALDPEDQQWADERWAAYQAAHPDLFPPANRGRKGGRGGRRRGKSG
jgi:hypothetical protein